MDERTAEIAATLMDVASFAKGAPKPSPSLPMRNTTQEPSRSPARSFRQLPINNPPPTFTTIFSMIGVGIDGDATEAALKAVRDAMERCMIWNALQKGQHRQFHIQLGAPLSHYDSSHLPRIDTSRLAQALPPGIPLQPIQVQVGGLLVPSGQDQATSSDVNMTRDTCVVVACLSVREQNANSVSKANSIPKVKSVSKAKHAPLPHHADARSPTSVTKSPTLNGANSEAAALPQKRRMVLLTSQQATSTPHALSPHGFHQQPNDIPRVPKSWEEVEQSQVLQQEQTHHNFHQQHQELQPSASNKTNQIPSRTNSIEMLARISAAMIGQHQLEDQQQKQHHDASSAQHMHEQREDIDDGEDTHGMRYAFKKLPPGKTPKNNLRLFVRHSYRDHSHEIPLLEELALMGPNALDRTPNAAFPLKLHEILSQIERDGYDNIIGWLPHGRSFKIHKQKEFVDTILPKYFVMTKKSSFLRQLNLYGFNRLNGGSYYHERLVDSRCRPDSPT